jgi:hypothetical protein
MHDLRAEGCLIEHDRGPRSLDPLAPAGYP